MKKKKNAETTGSTISKVLLEIVEPVDVMNRNQSSCEIRFGPKTTEVTVKVYADEAYEAAEEAIKEFKAAMKKIAVIEGPYRK